MSIAFELPDILLAERAGRVLAAHILTSPPPSASQIEVVASSSLVGAAALAAARHLANAGFRPSITLTDSSLDANDAFATMLEVAGCMDLPIRQVNAVRPTADDLIIDGTDTGVSNHTVSARQALAAQPEDNPAPWLEPATEDAALKADAIRAIDREAIESFGLPGLCLMENAALGAAGVILEMVRDNPATKANSVTLLAGPGNNGGDALAITRELIARGIPAQCYALAPTEKLKGDARANAEILNQADGSLREAPGNDDLREQLAASRLIVDGLFGTGLDRPVEGKARSLIEMANESDAPILALDIPSGLHADSGATLGVAVKADRTVTFAAPKIGFFVKTGRDHAGAITVAGIGCPRELIHR